MSQWAAFASDQTLGSFLRAQKAFVIIIDNLLVALIEFWCVKKSGRTGLVSRQVQRDEHERERPGYIVLGCVTSDRAIVTEHGTHRLLTAQVEQVNRARQVDPLHFVTWIYFQSVVC